MFRNIGRKTRKPAAVILVIALVCMIMTAWAEPVDVESLFGTISGDTYENPFFGLGCTLEGWHYYSEEEIENVNQTTKALLSEEVGALAAQNISIMVADSPTSAQNLNIQVRDVEEYVSLYESYGMKFVAEAGLESFVSSLESAGLTDVRMAVSEQNIGGQSFTCMKGEYKISDIPVFFAQAWMLKDKYLVYITATSVLTDETEPLFSYFYLIP